MDQNYEPMDIDLSVHSNSAMDISYNSSSSTTEIDAYLEANDFDLPPTESMPTDAKIPTAGQRKSRSPPTACTSINTAQSSIRNKFHINMEKEKKPYTISLKVKMICSAVIVLLAFATYQVLNIQCSENLNLEELNQTLSSKLFGQSRAISSLIEALSISERSKILFFYGSTGVGKTLTGSLILEHVGSYSNVYHYIMPSFMDTFSTDFMIGLSVCKHTIIIIDDLSAKDFDVKSHILDVITKSQNLGKHITIILTYNCASAGSSFERQCDESFPDKLLQNFSHIDAFKKLVKFEHLREEHLKQCIDSELRGRILSDTELGNILKNFNVSVDGCKGVYKKIKMLDTL